MSDHDNGHGAAVAEITASTELAKDFTLFQIEESLVLLAESAEEEGLTPEIERALTVYLEGEAASPAETLRSNSRARERHGAARPGLPRGEEVGGPNEHSQEEEVPALGQDH